jgi:hypothetical protein
MTTLERFLEALVTPFIDPQLAIEEYRCRENLGTSGLSVKSDARPARNALRNPPHSGPLSTESESGRVS